MKSLILLRHAKSSWKNASLPDFERPLNGRGRRAAAQLGSYLKKKRVRPDLVVSSTATRARETIGLVLDSARLRIELRYDERLYLADVDRLIGIVAQLEDEREQVMLVGHNPGMEELLARLTGADRHLPTAGMAKINFDVKAWADAVKTKSVRLEWFVKPRELEEDQ